MNRKLRVGMFVIGFPVISETYVVSMVQGLRESGFDTTIYTQRPSDDWRYFEGLRAVWERSVHIAPSVQSVWWGMISVIAAAIRSPRAFVHFVDHCWRWRKQNPRGFARALYTRANFVGRKLDVLTIVFDTQALAYVDLKHYLGCKLVLGSLMPFRESSTAVQFPEALNTLYDEADGYYFVSESLRQQAVESGFDTSKPHRVIPPAIDEDVFMKIRSNHQDAELRVVSVGRLVEQKGYQTNLAVMARVKNAGVPIRYVVIGDGASRGELEAMSERLGIREWVDFRGSMAYADMVSEMFQADVLLHLARYEGMSGVVIEAQAAGLPVISTRVDGQSEAIQDGLGGFLVESGDDQEAAEKIMRLAGDADLRRQMGIAGREYVMKHFSLEGQRKAFAELYRQVARWE